MASFDIVCKIDMGELKNAFNLAEKEIDNRYDFKGSGTKLELGAEEITITAPDEYKMTAALDILRTKMCKRGIGINALEAGDIVPTGNRLLKQNLKLKQGIDKEMGKVINKLVKNSGLKVSSSYMDEKIRITGKQIDDLQAIWAHLKSHKEVPLDLAMENMKR